MAVLPVDVVPLWQLVQLAVTVEWSKVAENQLLVVWQTTQSLVLLKCVGDLPTAVMPLWQLAQVPVTALWSTRETGSQLLELWQLSQELLLAICRGDFPVAVMPLWQLVQLPEMLP
ncbi:MAG: hypothetical protein R8K46_07080 [Mariprofundaceae bacterium]